MLISSELCSLSAGRAEGAKQFGRMTPVWSGSCPSCVPASWGSKRIPSRKFNFFFYVAEISLYRSRTGFENLNNFFFQGKRRRVGSCWGVGSCLAVTPTLERVWDVDPVSSGRATRLGRRMCWSFLSKEERRWIALSDRSIASRCFCWPCTTRPEFDFGPLFFVGNLWRCLRPSFG